MVTTEMQSFYKTFHWENRGNQVGAEEPQAV